MQYETPEGLCAVVTLREEGCRLQQFVARNFREHLGRQPGYMHVNVRQYAAIACERGHVEVDGLTCPGRRCLRSGELVMLRPMLEMEPPKAKGAPRMLLEQLPRDAAGALEEFKSEIQPSYIIYIYIPYTHNMLIVGRTCEVDHV